jgi:hypothetical protein
MLALDIFNLKVEIVLPVYSVLCLLQLHIEGKTNNNLQKCSTAARVHYFTPLYIINIVISVLS